jgi:hypothetical protein
MRDIIGERSWIVSHTSQVGAGSRSPEFDGASVTVFFINSVVGRENKIIRMCNGFGPKFVRFVCDAVILVSSLWIWWHWSFRQKNNVASVSTNSDCKMVYRMQELARGYEVTP